MQTQYSLTLFLFWKVTFIRVSYTTTNTRKKCIVSSFERQTRNQNPSKLHYNMPKPCWAHSHSNNFKYLWNYYKSTLFFMYLGKPEPNLSTRHKNTKHRTKCVFKMLTRLDSIYSHHPNKKQSCFYHFFSCCWFTFGLYNENWHWACCLLVCLSQHFKVRIFC